MKKAFIFFIFLLLPVFASASIDQNLYYGMAGNSSVKELQNFLISKGFLTGSATGNFYSLTLNAVKKYQASKNINTTGYVGQLTRQAINAELSTATTPAAPAAPATGNQTPASPATFTGNLVLAKNLDYKDQSVTAPQTKFKLSDFTLTNSTSEIINIKKIQVDLAIGSNLYTSNQYISNLYLSYAESLMSVISAPAHNNYWDANFQIPKGGSINISLYGDVNSSIPLNSVVHSSLLISGVSAISLTNVFTNSNAVLVGQNITFGTSSLTASADNISSTARITTANQRVAAARFKFTSSKDSYVISELKFTIPNSSTVSIISGAVLSDETQAVLTPNPVQSVYDGRQYIFNFTGLNIPVSLNGSKSVTVSYDLKNVSSQKDVNKDIAPALIYIKAKNSRQDLVDGFASDYGNLTAPYGGVTLPAKGVTASSLYVFKSIPTFSAKSLQKTALSGSNAEIYNFSISADAKGDIAVKQLTFKITISDPNRVYSYLNNFTFLKGDKDYTSSVLMGQIMNNSNYIGVDRGVGIGTSNIILVFNKEEVIPAGTTQTYSLKAQTNSFISSSAKGANTISVNIPSDSARSTTGSYLRSIFLPIYGLSDSQGGIYPAVYNVLWSDMSAVNFSTHSDANGSATEDWYNGYLVPGLALPSQTISAK